MLLLEVFLFALGVVCYTCEHIVTETNRQALKLFQCTYDECLYVFEWFTS